MEAARMRLAAALMLGVAPRVMPGLSQARDRGVNQPGVAANIGGVARRTVRR